MARNSTAVQLMDLLIKETTGGVGKMNFYVIKTKDKEHGGVRMYNPNNEFAKYDVHKGKIACKLRGHSLLSTKED
uniref:Ribosomal_L33 domain-containing protein n=1 Tax=Rhabditophanes sp. KR3021 TaxID=114890 RepID=A0AC35U2C1_9BILA